MPIGKRTGDGFYCLREEIGGGSSRYLYVDVTPGGDVVVRGHDMGGRVAEFFGDLDENEYEWTETIRAPHVPELRRVLDVHDGDLARAIAQRFSGDASYDFETRIRTSGIPVETSTWLH